MTTIEDVRRRLAELVADVPDTEIAVALRLLASAGADLEVRLRLAQARATAPTADGEQLLTVPEAAKLIAMSPSYVKALIASGKLPSVVLPGTPVGVECRRERTGKARRVRRRDVLMLVARAEDRGDERKAA